MFNLTIAFASCMDADDDSSQSVWGCVLKKQPQVLLLLGDSVYMDYSYSCLGSKKPRGQPQKDSPEEFANKLYELYRKQWAVASFRELVRSGIQIGIIWDDHDFAWNNSRGAGVLEPGQDINFKTKFLMSRRLFLQFKTVIQLWDKNASYPDMPYMPTESEVQLDKLEGIQEAFDIDGVRFIMLDGRTFRQDTNNERSSTLHGEEQLNWLHQQLSTWSGPKVICSGSVMSRAKIWTLANLAAKPQLAIKIGERWEQYKDYQWLLNQAAEQVIVLSGDIHENVPPILHRKHPALYEIVSSGAARTSVAMFDGNVGNYGILTLGTQNQVELFKFDHSEGITPLRW